MENSAHIIFYYKRDRRQIIYRMIDELFLRFRNAIFIPIR